MLTKHLDCACYSAEHTLHLMYDEEDNQLYITFHLGVNGRHFFRRILDSLKYIFGYKCKYGHFDEFMFQASDCEELIDLLGKMKEKG